LFEFCVELTLHSFNLFQISMQERLQCPLDPARGRAVPTDRRSCWPWPYDWDHYQYAVGSRGAESSWTRTTKRKETSFRGSPSKV